MEERDAMSDVQVLLSRLEKVRKNGSSWRAACPAHGGKDANLKVSTTPEGHILVKCFSHGCAVEDIVGAVGLTLQDIMPESRHGEMIKSSPNTLTASEGLRLIKFETQIVLASAYAQRKGQFSTEDIERLEVSMNRIHNVMRACGV
jgi:hypothetical protein